MISGFLTRLGPWAPLSPGPWRPCSPWGPCGPGTCQPKRCREATLGPSSPPPPSTRAGGQDDMSSNKLCQICIVENSIVKQIHLSAKPKTAGGIGQHQERDLREHPPRHQRSAHHHLRVRRVDPPSTGQPVPPRGGWARGSQGSVRPRCPPNGQLQAAESTAIPHITNVRKSHFWCCTDAI